MTPSKESGVSDKLKVGIVGIGAIGKVHAKAYEAGGEVEIAALCDVEEDRLTTEGKRLDVADRFTDYRELLAADIDAVSVCVGNALHREVAIAALEAWCDADKGNRDWAASMRAWTKPKRRYLVSTLDGSSRQQVVADTLALAICEALYGATGGQFEEAPTDA